MLSRVAEAIYWMQRYTERAENIARFIDVNLHLMLDMPNDISEQWAPLVQVTGDYERFEEMYEEPTREHVIEFLTFNREYPNSIHSCLSSARENARSVREIISSEMWEHLNTLYLKVSRTSMSDIMDAPYRFYEEVKMDCHLLAGLADATMLHDEGWHFGRLGDMLERADKTSRILDVKYFFLLPEVKDVGTPFDNIGWGALLKSASALEMYRKKYGPISPPNVVAFLVLEREFPRAINFCLNEVVHSLHAINGSPADTFSNPAERAVGRLCGELNYTAVDEIIGSGLHEFLDELQIKFNEIHQAVYETYFDLKAVG